MQQSCQTYNNSWYIDAESFSHVALTSHRPAPGRARPPADRRPRAGPRPEKPTEPPNDPRDAGGEPRARDRDSGLRPRVAAHEGRGTVPADDRARAKPRPPAGTSRPAERIEIRAPASSSGLPAETRPMAPDRRSRFENQTFRVFSTARNEALNRFRRPPSERKSICLIAACHALWAQTRTEDRTKRTEGAARLRAAQHRNYLADGHCTSIELLNGDPGFPFASSSASSRRPTLPSAVCLRSRWR